LVNVGREDVDVDALTPLEAGLTVLGASSGSLALEVGAQARCPEVGDELRFALGYGALLQASTSHYVAKRALRGGVVVQQMP
ncbi:MAG: hypothetical protein JSW68_15310, partial [Burkholderiales bacterium]